MDEAWEKQPHHVPSVAHKKKLFASLGSKQVIQAALAGMPSTALVQPVAVPV